MTFFLRARPTCGRPQWTSPQTFIGVVIGFFNYHAVPTNSRALATFRHRVTVLWQRTLRRRSQKDRTSWDRMAGLVNDWLPDRVSFIHGQARDLPSDTRGGSRMRESRTYGSVRCRQTAQFDPPRPLSRQETTAASLEPSHSERTV